jgi:hypothetical protein
MTSFSFAVEENKKELESLEVTTPTMTMKSIQLNARVDFIRSCL